MAIRIPKPNAKPRTNEPPATSKLIEATEVVTTRHVTNTLVTTPPVQNNRRIMIAASVVMLLIIGATVVAIGLPMYQKYRLNTKTPIPSEPTLMPQPVAKPALAKVAASQPTASQPADNLNQQTIVITGDQLGNGVAPASTVSTDSVTTSSVTTAATVNPASVSTITQNVAPPVASAPPTNQSPISANNGPNAGNALSQSNQRNISYEEFVQTSKQSVFVDR